MKGTLSKAIIIYSISLLLIYYSSTTFATLHSNDYISPRAESSNLPEPPFNLTLNNQFTKEHNDTNIPSYAPENIPCPSGENVTFIRPSTSGVDPKEKEYISSRSSSLTSPQLRSFTRSALISSNSTNQSSATTDLDRIFGNEALRPKAAMAFSGGGFRAMLNGAGIFKALDNRTSTVPEFAGLLQGMDYMAGLSGGNWLVGSTALNNFASVDELRRDHWRLENGVITGVKGDPRDHLDDVVEYLGGIKSQVMQKSRAGFNVTLTDYWGLALGRQLIDEKGGGANITWSDIQDMDSFRHKSMPYPISIAVGRKPGEKVVEKNSTVYESTPYTFGSWDREVGYFFPMKYLGTRMQNGKPKDEKKCVRGFDSGPFVMGTSSSLFSGISSRIDRKKVLKDRGKTTIREGNIKRDRKLWDKFRIPGERLLVDVLERVNRGNFEFAEYPNPFQGYSPSNSSSRNSNKTTDLPPNFTKNYSTLYLADGGLDNQNIPLWPLLQPAREIDFILAVDSSADTPQHWPNGSSLVSTQKRVKNLLNKQKPGDVGVVPFPYVPEDTRTWVDQELNSRPVFFGCNGGNYSTVTTGGKENNSTTGNKPLNSTQNQDRNLLGPLIVYLPNVPWTYYTNTSTFQLDYIPEEVDGFLSNGAEQISQSVSTNTTTKANTTTPSWKTCLSCAILQRSKERAKIAVGDTCQRCFEKYCWGGGYPETPLPQGQNNTNIREGEVYDPARKDGSGKGWEEQYNFIRGERERQGVGRDN